MRYCAIGLLVALLAFAAPAGAQMYLELGSAPVRDAIPPDCSDWHELHPNFCAVHHQDAYEDDGDGEVSVCDAIIIDGTRYHIDWVGPTYYLVETSTADVMFCEPTIPDPGDDPTCEIWHEVAPDFCMEHHVDGWEDNGDQVLSPCDLVLIDGSWWHVEEIRLDITVSEEPSPVEGSTWSKIKDFFRALF